MNRGLKLQIRLCLAEVSVLRPLLARLSIRSRSLALLNDGKAADEVLVEDAHLGSKLGPNRCALRCHLAPNGRKLSAHLATELRNLRHEIVHPGGKLFEFGHAVLEFSYSGLDRLRRQRRSPLRLHAPIGRDKARGVSGEGCADPLTTDDATIVGATAANCAARSRCRLRRTARSRHRLRPGAEHDGV